MWSVVQGLYAVVAWSIAVRAVARTSALLGALDPALISQAKSLVRRGDRGGATALVERAGHPALVFVVEAEKDDEDVLDRVDVVGLEYGPPTRGLRGMATIGTSLGLLAAIATILTSVASPSRGAAQAFERALMGFVTAIPLWTAATIAGQQMRRVRKSLDRFGLALAGDDAEPRSAEEPASEGDSRSEPITEDPEDER
ncbi:MAG: hypothetical protein JNK05_04285 [Myxococcales bacterium]|nr:hypothetical protein [Myxococcales bacterium]